jgi:hypothetical protein
MLAPVFDPLCTQFVLYSALRATCASAKGVEVGLKRHATAERACARLTAMLSDGEPAACQTPGVSSLPSSRTISRARMRLQAAVQDACDESSPDLASALSPDCSPSSASFAAILGDITDAACIYRDATIVVLCNIMFGGYINGRVVHNMTTRCPRLRTVASIVQLHHPRLHLRRTVLVPCTWSQAGVSWHVYEMVAGPTKEIRAREACWLTAPKPPAPRWTRPKTVQGTRMSADARLVSAARPMTRSGRLADASVILSAVRARTPLSTKATLVDPDAWVARLAGAVDSQQMMRLRNRGVAAQTDRKR